MRTIPGCWTGFRGSSEMPQHRRSPEAADEWVETLSPRWIQLTRLLGTNRVPALSSRWTRAGLSQRDNLYRQLRDSPGELPISRTDLFLLLASDRHSSNSGKETERFPLLSPTKRPVGNDRIARGLERLRWTFTEKFSGTKTKNRKTKL